MAGAEPAARCRFGVRVTPRGGRDAVEGADAAGALRVRVAAPAADGAANRAAIRLLADALRLAPSAVVIVAGATARLKGVEVSGIGPAEVAARWPGVDVRAKGSG